MSAWPYHHHWRWGMRIPEPSSLKMSSSQVGSFCCLANTDVPALILSGHVRTDWNDMLILMSLLFVCDFDARGYCGTGVDHKDEPFCPLTQPSPPCGSLPFYSCNFYIYIYNYILSTSLDIRIQDVPVGDAALIWSSSDPFFRVPVLPLYTFVGAYP